MDDLSQEDVESVTEAVERMDEPQEAPEPNPADDGGPETAPETEPLDSTVPPETPNEQPETSGGISRAQFMQLEEVASATNISPESLEKMKDLKVNVQVVLGNSRMTLENILKLQTGSVVELNKLAGEPVDIMANDKLVARAEVVVVDGNFGVKVIEIAGMQQKLRAVT
jgi:flagellar motor switch protein FliN/FliY